VLRRNGSTGISDGAIPTVEELLLSKYTTQSEHEPTEDGLPKIDLLISNPPYISTSDFNNGTTTRSVRLFEPRLALVPPTDVYTSTNGSTTGYEGDKPEDIFYRRILELSLDVQASITVLECGDRMQAERVIGMVRGMSALRLESDGGGGESEGDGFTVEVWPGSEEDCLVNGFHGRDGSRCVVIRREMNG
jgi:methylase of polypeptide subunit release factors